MRLPDNEDLAFPTPSSSPLHSAAPTIADHRPPWAAEMQIPVKRKSSWVPRGCQLRETVSALHSPSQVPFAGYLRHTSQNEEPNAPIWPRPLGSSHAASNLTSLVFSSPCSQCGRDKLWADGARTLQAVLRLPGKTYVHVWQVQTMLCQERPVAGAHLAPICP